MPTATCLWDGKVLTPIRGHDDRISEIIKPGNRCVIEVDEERSSKSERHYFAAIREAWRSLPEEKYSTYETPKKLRKWALIRTGWCDVTDLSFETERQALMVASFTRKLDEYAVVIVKENIVRVYRAKSQKRSAMLNDEFKQSKNDVLDLLSNIIGTTRRELERQAEKEQA